MTKQLVKPCEFVGGACINCAATEQSDCEGWVCSPKRPWVGLTDEEIESAISDGFARGLDDGNVSNKIVVNYVRVIEAALKEKNHD